MNAHGYIVMVDKFMSGWGKAPGTSYYALRIDSVEERLTVMANAKARSEMTKIRFTVSLPECGEGDNLKVVTKKEAARWYEPGAFDKESDQ